MFIAIALIVFVVLIITFSNEKKYLKNYCNNLEREKKQLQYRIDDLQKENKFIKTLEKDMQKLKGQAFTLNQTLSLLQKENKELAKYTTIRDLKEEEKRIKEKIKEKEQKAQDYLEQAYKYYRETIYRTDLEVQKIKDTLDAQIKDPLELLEKCNHLSEFIEGYDKYYFLPSISVFDDLSQKYGFSDAGQQLKFARERIQYLLNNGLAVKSETKNDFAKKTFESFFLNSFDSKIQLFLNEIKTTKYYILERRIKSVFDQTNIISLYYEKTQITKEYLDARLEEIKWIYRLNDFIKKRREEDAARREEQREKLKAQKEIEKAILKKQKEIDTLNEEIQKLTLDMKNLPDESIEKEQKKLELRKKEEKLKKLTEIQNKAKSMREMGYKGGVVYIISNKGSYGENIYKIGVTQRYDDVECCFAPEKRVHELFSSGVPFPFDIHAFIETEEAYELEKKLHNKFCLQRLNKVNKYKEFFTVSINEIKEYVESLGFYPKWTLESEIAQWEETQKINKKLSEDAIFRDSFIKEWGKTIFYNEEELETK